MEAGQEAQVSEAQIAVHWREEEYYYAARERSSRRRTRPTRPSSSGSARRTSRTASRSTPTCSPGTQYWHTTLDTSNPPFWKWFVGGRLNACYNCVDRHLAASPEQGGAHLGARAGDRRARRTITYQELYRRVNEFAALLRDFCGAQGRRPGDPAHADGARAAGHHAGLRPARRHPLAGVRRVQRRGLRRPDRRLGEPDPDHDGRLLPQRRADRPQGQGRRGGRGGARRRARRSTRCWSGGATRASTHRRRPMVEGRDFFVDELLQRLPRRSWSSRCRCRPRRRCS